MKVLITIPWFTPAFKAGGPIRSVEQMIKACEDSISFAIVCGNRDVDNSILKVSKLNCWTPHAKDWLSVFCKIWPQAWAPDFLQCSSMSRKCYSKCLEMAGWLSENGATSSLTVASPCAKRARMARRVGSASAAKVASRRA